MALGDGRKALCHLLSRAMSAAGANATGNATVPVAASLPHKEITARAKQYRQRIDRISAHEDAA
jgi:hypothetical protein